MEPIALFTDAPPAPVEPGSHPAEEAAVCRAAMAFYTSIRPGGPYPSHGPLLDACAALALVRHDAAREAVRAVEASK